MDAAYLGLAGVAEERQGAAVAPEDFSEGHTSEGSE
jgi:hypothetical protein